MFSQVDHSLQGLAVLLSAVGDTWSGYTVVCLRGVKQGAQNIALGCSSVNDQGGRGAANVMSSICTHTVCNHPELILSLSLPFSCHPSCGSRCSSPAPTMKPSRQPQSTTLPSRRSSRPSTRPALGPGSKSRLSKTSSPSAPEGVKGPRDS